MMSMGGVSAASDLPPEPFAPSPYRNYYNKKLNPLHFNSGSASDFEEEADGGFVLYPNKANSNQMRSVYSK